jgi:hypothetical protein
MASGIPVIGFPLRPEHNFKLKVVEGHGAGVCFFRRSLKRGLIPPGNRRIFAREGYRDSAPRRQYTMTINRKDQICHAP